MIFMCFLCFLDFLVFSFWWDLLGRQLLAVAKSGKIGVRKAFELGPLRFVNLLFL